jgi:hypothetical protein
MKSADEGGIELTPINKKLGSLDRVKIARVMEVLGKQDLDQFLKFNLASRETSLDSEDTIRLLKQQCDKLYINTLLAKLKEKWDNAYTICNNTMKELYNSEKVCPYNQTIKNLLNNPDRISIPFTQRFIKGGKENKPSELIKILSIPSGSEDERNYYSGIIEILKAPPTSGGTRKRKYVKRRTIRKAIKSRGKTSKKRKTKKY